MVYPGSVCMFRTVRRIMYMRRQDKQILEMEKHEWKIRRGERFRMKETEKRKGKLKMTCCEERICTLPHIKISPDCVVITDKEKIERKRVKEMGVGGHVSIF